jgi:epoxyqueuosine reductase
LSISKKDWQDITAETFAKVFKNSALKRTKLEGLERNIKFVQISEYHFGATFWLKNI